jgi:hypothetical protein
MLNYLARLAIHGNRIITKTTIIVQEIGQEIMD